MVVNVDNEKGKDMTEQVPDLTEVIDVTSLPNWSDPQVQETFAKIDDFLINGGGVKRERPARRVPQSTPPAPEEADDFIEVDLRTPEGFRQAIEIVEQYVVECFLVTHAPGVPEAAKVDLYNDVIAYLRPLPNGVLMGVIMRIADSAAGLACKVAELQGTGFDEPVA
jgi:hypothetical protein